MKIKSILVSQPKPTEEHSPYFEIAKKHKVKITFRPFIHVESVEAKEVRIQKIEFSHYDAVIFTSKNAIDNYFRLAEEMRFVIPEEMKYYCQSEAIEKYLAKFVVMRKRKVYVGKKTVEELLPVFKKHESKSYLLPCSDVLNDDVINALNKSKINWEKVVLFKTVGSDLSDIEIKDYDMLVFFSHQGIRSLFENFPDFKQNETKIAAFGHTTLLAAQEFGLIVSVPDGITTYRSMTEALDKFLKEN